MRFKVDENLPIEIADLLNHAGHHATTVRDEALSGSSDLKIASVCREERRALITLDTDFADVQLYPPEQFSGLIVLRLRRQDKPYVLEICGRFVPLLFTEPLDRHLWIVEDHQVRIRGSVSKNHNN